MEAWETETETALRELYEETGLTADLDITHAESITYPISAVAYKQVVFYLGKVTGVPKTRDGEIDTFKWVTREELKDYLFPDTCAACCRLIEESR